MIKDQNSDCIFICDFQSCVGSDFRRNSHDSARRQHFAAHQHQRQEGQGVEGQCPEEGYPNDPKTVTLPMAALKFSHAGLGQTLLKQNNGLGQAVIL